MKSILLDSGRLIALFAVDDKHHRHFDEPVTSLSRDGLRLLTTWPCIVKVSYLLATPQRYEMLHWVELGGVLVYPFERSSGGHDKWMRHITRKTRREMDLADASIYWLAIKTGVTST